MTDGIRQHSRSDSHRSSKPAKRNTRTRRSGSGKGKGTRKAKRTESSELRERNGRLSQKTREGMQSALDTLMKKWMDSCETGEKVKEDFKCGLEKLVKNSAEDNGVWQMMVSASALHQRQEHDLEKLQKENNDLRTRVNGMYGSESTRVVGEKSKAESELVRPDFATDGGGEDIWNMFARDISSTQF